MKLLKTILDMKRNDFYIIPFIYYKEDIDWHSIVIHLLFLSMIDEEKKVKKKKKIIFHLKKVRILNDNEIFTASTDEISFYVLFSFILTELTKKKKL